MGHSWGIAGAWVAPDAATGGVSSEVHSCADLWRGGHQAALSCAGDDKLTAAHRVVDLPQCASSGLPGGATKPVIAVSAYCSQRPLSSNAPCRLCQAPLAPQSEAERRMEILTKISTTSR